jgi:hypothetical protein
VACFRISASIRRDFAGDYETLEKCALQTEFFLLLEVSPCCLNISVFVDGTREGRDEE